MRQKRHIHTACRLLRMRASHDASRGGSKCCSATVSTRSSPRHTIAALYVVCVLRRVCVCVCVCACVCVSHGPMHICGQAPHTQSRACTHTQPHARSLPRWLSRTVAVSHCCSLLPPSICSHPNPLAGHHKTRRTPQGINVRCSTKHTTLGSTKYIARNTTKSTRGWTRLLDTSLPQRPAYNAEEASTE